MFSSLVLEPHDNFEVRIDAVDSKWSGALKIGVTSFSISGMFFILLLGRGLR